MLENAEPICWTLDLHVKIIVLSKVKAPFFLSSLCNYGEVKPMKFFATPIYYYGGGRQKQMCFFATSYIYSVHLKEYLKSSNWLGMVGDSQEYSPYGKTWLQLYPRNCMHRFESSVHGTNDLISLSTTVWTCLVSSAAPIIWCVTCHVSPEGSKRGQVGPFSLLESSWGNLDQLSIHWWSDTELGAILMVMRNNY